MKGVEKSRAFRVADRTHSGAETSLETSLQRGCKGRSRYVPRRRIADGIEAINRVAVICEELFQRHRRHDFPTAAHNSRASHYLY